MGRGHKVVASEVKPDTGVVVEILLVDVDLLIFIFLCLPSYSCNAQCLLDLLVRYEVVVLLPLIIFANGGVRQVVMCLDGVWVYCPQCFPSVDEIFYLSIQLGQTVEVKRVILEGFFFLQRVPLPSVVSILLRALVPFFRENICVARPSFSVSISVLWLPSLRYRSSLGGAWSSRLVHLDRLRLAHGSKKLRLESNPKGKDGEAMESLPQEFTDNNKCCTDCKTTKTPLWRGGLVGPKVILHYSHIAITI
ncbi:GATA transcription factor 16 [Senna tora]|uniref:GATA transcription factor 16 n=1 Tax=Senna tora TaxID=362788 RepID=A0A834THM7_9FABA|nr:GATA transcription factor 16 [Senna tora]